MRFTRRPASASHPSCEGSPTSPVVNQFLFCFPHFNCPGASHPQAPRGRLLCQQNEQLRCCHRFRSVPSAEVVSHTSRALSRGFQMSLTNSSTAQRLPMTAIPTFASISSDTSVPLVFALLHRREEVSHIPRNLSRGCKRRLANASSPS